MGNGASVGGWDGTQLADRLPKDQAMKIGARYGFTEERFNLLQVDGTVSVKDVIDSVKNHAALQKFDVNHDGKIDGTELKALSRVITSDLSKELSRSRVPKENFKSAIAGTVRQEDYLKYYQPMGELGTGMSGTVFSVRNLSSHVQYACKSVRKRGLKPAELAKLKGEVRLLSQLDHPNIVKIVESFEDASTVTIIMELCTGGELYDSLITAEYYSENVARQIFRQIVHAISYCHNQVGCRCCVPRKP